MNNNEPTSFLDLRNNFTKAHENYRVTTVPLYMVNISSGKMTKVDNSRLLGKKNIEMGSFCRIEPVINIVNKNFLHFTVRDENKNDNKLTDIVFGRFYSGNYELFLHKKDAARKARTILMEKFKKLRKEINLLENIIYGDNNVNE